MRKLVWVLATLAICAICGCAEKRVDIINEEYENFSDLTYEESPNYPLFSNHRSLPVEITLGGWEDYNSILFLTESANVFPIGRSNLEKLLPAGEFKDLLQNYCEPRVDSFLCEKQYYPYSRIIKKRYVLLEMNIREYGGRDRHYVFELRTYTPKGALIDKIEFAKWSGNDQDFFAGKITTEMQVEISSSDTLLHRYDITDDGYFIEL